MRTSTGLDQALTLFTNRVFKELDKPNNNVIVVFFDLKKTFNSLLHTFLVNDLIDIFKINVNLACLNYSFLSDRKIRIGSFQFCSFPDNRGIGQGTVNGPAFYICYFNRVKDVLFDCVYYVFADDLCLTINDTDANRGIERMEVVLTRLDNWCTENGLTMSYGKTKFMVIPVVKKLECNGHEIERVSVFKYLGVLIDDRFTFKMHADHVLDKISSNAGLINKQKRMLTPHMLTLLINSYINSATDYCLPVWVRPELRTLCKCKKSPTIC